MMTLSICISITLVNLTNIILFKTNNPLALNAHSSWHSAHQSLNVCRKKAMRKNMEKQYRKKRKKEKEDKKKVNGNRKTRRERWKWGKLGKKREGKKTQAHKWNVINCMLFHSYEEPIHIHILICLPFWGQGKAALLQRLLQRSYLLTFPGKASMLPLLSGVSWAALLCSSKVNN